MSTKTDHLFSDFGPDLLRKGVFGYKYRNEHKDQIQNLPISLSTKVFLIKIRKNEHHFQIHNTRIS